MKTRIGLSLVILYGLGTTPALPQQIPGATAPPPRIGGTPGSPDLVPATDGGKIRKFESRWEWRHAFWAKNAGTVSSAPSQIRLKFYYKTPGVDPYADWKLHADLVLDVPRLQPGEESRALVTRLLYRDKYAWDALSGDVYQDMQPYKWEFWVDSQNGVTESNEQNNPWAGEGAYPEHDALETGPSGSFH